MIDAPFVDKKLDGLGNVIRIRAIQLETAWRFTRTKVGKLERLVSTFNERTRIDHFADVESCAELPANRSERIVRHTCHRRQYNRGPDSHLSDVHSQKFSWLGKLNVTVKGTSVNRMHRS